MVQTRSTLSAALERIGPADRTLALKAAVLGVAHVLARHKKKTSQPLSDPEHYLGCAWEHYIDGPAKHREWIIIDYKDVVRLLVTFADFFIRRDAYPKSSGSPTDPLEEILDGPVVEDETISPQIKLERDERQKLESAILENLLTQRNSSTRADELLFANFIKLLREDDQVLNNTGTGHYRLDAGYAADRLGITGAHASTLWYRFKRLCRNVDNPELRSLIEKTEPRWLNELSVPKKVNSSPEREADDTNDQTHTPFEGLLS